jgi:nucleoside-diphosphate-sugar epimerase
MRAVVFGGSGFLGTHLTAALADDGVEVTIADLVPPDRLPEGARYERVDVREPIRLAHDRPFDSVYNLAAVHRTPGHAPEEYYQTNVNGARTVTEWCDAGGERSIFFTSSIAVYGRADSPTTEVAPTRPESDYGRSKLEAEQIHRRWLRENTNRRLIVSRPGAIFGPGEGGNFTRLAASMRARRFMYPGRRDVVKACGYVGDFINSVRFAEQLPDSEFTYNFAYPAHYTSGDVCNALHRVAGVPLPKTVPAPLIRLGVATLGRGIIGKRGIMLAQRVSKLLTSTDIVPQALIDRGFDWKTDLEGGFRAWMSDEPAGQLA